MTAAEILRLPDRYRRALYRQLVAEARSRGERSVSYMRWLSVVRRLARLEARDQGGTIRL